MNKNIEQLIYKLYESNLFDDDIFLLDSLDNIMTDIEEISGMKTSLFNIMMNIFGTDKPRGWKKDFSNNEEKLFYEDKNVKWSKSKYITDVEEILKQYGYKEYKNTNNPIATNNNFSSLSKYKDSKIQQQLEPNFWIYNTNYNNNYMKQFKEILNYPDFIKQYFINSNILYYTKVLLSPDEGIIYTLRNIPNGSYITYNIRHHAEIKFTGKVNYEDISLDERDKKLKIYNDNKKRIQILRTAYNKSDNLGLFKNYKINDEGYPYSLYFFNWQNEVSKSYKNYKKLNIPFIVYKLYKYGKYELLSNLDKEDPDSVFEFVKNSIIIKIYNTKHKEDTTTTNNAYMILELTGYLKEHYKLLFLD